MSGRSIASPVLGWLSIMILVGSRAGWCSEFDGFTEPSRRVKVASVETGTIKTLEVREGAAVEKGQILARLDDDVYLVLLEIAAESMRAQGALKSAQAELDMRRDRSEKLDALRAQGHARQEEVDRAHADVEIAEARVLSAEEFMEVKRLEHEKAKIQVARRLVLAPLSGVVTELHKDEGEFVAPNDPYVLEIVTLDPLLATFSVPSYEAARLRQDEKVSVYLEDAAKIVEGDVDAVAPLTDAESGTVRVKVRIANRDGQFRGGERCTLQLKNASVVANPRP